ncbi:MULTISPECIES: hypothetical protein [Xanthobacteraceae]|uniref:Uncharacterized protein n=1 Tax=Labrys monachus TaxID=217067 RepID=A0ABU0FG08_9HYPH|nr:MULTISPECIES: hypothetical protein [Xanthobacteraceae]MBS7540652.1 hypothetical protein [Ancylobacter lacus]MDQ0393544.1 hypothetical protein [Labrys monachus]
MTARQDKIRIAVFGPADVAEMAESSRSLSSDTVLQLARLIGRQIAREQHERERAKEQQQRRPINSDEQQ